ncbi:carboxypeptidase-like regulatory domain-containing protein [Aquimarina intermedia]|uniref:Carboxypeptidase-like protein n=1 Tax=Aquimarina intermedia TaxID=350814 RepID=A0A5S5CF10_9FLAO|nr:carboxypeptidase-like regulatory domain-containing protein [Aquimarina intermedia]TYP76930.1 carboxypeptidase-like protein [Aquimarina intermedia]
MRHLLSPNRWSSYLFIFCFTYTINSQRSSIKGTVVDQETSTPLKNVQIALNNTTIFTKSDNKGAFIIRIPDDVFGDQILIFSCAGYSKKIFPIYIVEGEVLDLDRISLQYDHIADNKNIGIISLSNEQLISTEDVNIYHSGVLQATKDVFLSAAAYDFSSTFFRPRGLGNEYGKVLINGLEMNKLINGRPLWSSWGGLNDVLRNQTYYRNLKSSEVAFGDLGGSTHITMRASQYKGGGRVSYALANRSYTGRVMGSYHSGLTKKGWAYSLAISRRFGDEGIIEGTAYNANSFFVSVEKQINDRHALNLTGFYTPIKRGKSTAITEEVFRLKGKEYNPNWGYLNGEKINAKVQVVEEPVFMLNYYWQVGEKTSLNTSVGFQTGNRYTTRLDNGGTDLLTDIEGTVGYSGGGRSKTINPMHPEHLPSFYLQKSQNKVTDFQKAYLAEHAFLNSGQIEWNELFTTNQRNKNQNKNATYVLLQDKTEDNQLIVSSLMNSELSRAVSISGGVQYRNLVSQNYAEVGNMLGGTGFLDIDNFARFGENQTNKEVVKRAQNDLKNPNRVVTQGDTYKYNYKILASETKGFFQGEADYKRMNVSIAAALSATSYQRVGLYENGYFPGKRSIGSSDRISFTNYGFKTGLTAKLQKNMFLETNMGYFTKAPTLENSFVNARQNNLSISDITKEGNQSEEILSIDAGYILQNQKLKIRLSGYYTTILKATDISYYYTEAIEAEDSGLVQELLFGIDKQYFGGEVGVSYQITPTLRLRTVAALGQHTYDNTPNLWLASTSSAFVKDGGIKNMGKVYLKNYRLSGGPQTVAQLGFDYRDPDFWWLGTSVNYFSGAYIGISSFARTDNFYKDSDGLPFNEYDQQTAQKLLQQERFDDYILVNAVGGKSWRIKGYTFGFFASISNVLNQLYKTGGFESSRRANYRLALEESQRETPIYGSRYFYGASTSYYLNFYCRF